MAHVSKRFINAIKYRRQFYMMLPLGITIGLLLTYSTDWAWSTNLLISWNSVISIYLFQIFRVMLAPTNVKQIEEKAKQQDESKWIITFLVLSALTMCLFAIIVHLAHLPPHGYLKFIHIALVMLTIITAWLFMHTIFALHYAHDFYIARTRGKETGLEFPKTNEPMYLDFIYFSYVIGTASQTADVSITTQHMRLLNTFHFLLAFGFNTGILAICINIAASLITR